MQLLISIQISIPEKSIDSFPITETRWLEDKVGSFEIQPATRDITGLTHYSPDMANTPWPPLVTGLPGLHDNAASADAYRWSVVTNTIRIHVKSTYLWKIVKKSGIGLSVWNFFH